MKKQISHLRKLSLEEMTQTKGGMSCDEFLDVVVILITDPRANWQAQGYYIFETYFSQYCDF